MKRAQKKSNKYRPSLDDVERISYGQAAQKRGVGSRGVPHRLNAAERKEWDLAKKRGFVLLRGSGWRKERGDSPLANIYRNLCDSKAIPCISVARGLGIDGEDVVTIDFSPLRTLQYDAERETCLQLANDGRYTSLVGKPRENSIESMEWGDGITEEVVNTEVIWRLPAYGVVVNFSTRQDSRRYAEAVAHAIIGGPKPDFSVFDDDDDDDGGGGGGGGGGGDESGEDTIRAAAVEEEALVR